MLMLLKLLAALPPGVQRLLSGGLVEIDGQRLDGPTQIINALINRTGRPLEECTPNQVRERMAQLQKSPPERAVSRVEDRSIPAAHGVIPVRVYTPDGGPQDAEPEERPALVHFHGGGWVLGTLDGHDYVCSCLAARSGCVVVSVDYRLAPEHRYPAAIDDCVTAYRHIVEHGADFGIDPQRVAVGGDSAGGNLAAALSQRMQREQGPMPAFQLLVYPAVDLVGERPSYELFADGFLLTRAAMGWFKDHYIPDHGRRSELDASPLLAEDLSGQPPARVVLAGFDPLRDEGRAYAERLKAAGVPVTVDLCASTMHGFFGLGFALPVADAAVTRAAAALRGALAEGHWLLD